MELYHKYRPSAFKQLIGQEIAVRTLTSLLSKKHESFPHALLLTGPSGCGKTTIARIIKDKLDCSDRDFLEMDSAQDRGIGTIRNLYQITRINPLSPCRIILLDEAHQLTRDAQDALLKILEDTPDHTFFVLSTTEPEQLLSTIRTRCTHLALQELNKVSLEQLVRKILGKEGKTLSENTIISLVEAAEGSARKVLVLLNQILGIESEEEQLNAIQKSDIKKQSEFLGRMLLNPKISWKEVAEYLRTIEDNSVEGIRLSVLKYMTAVVLNNHKNPLARKTIEYFRDNWFSCGKAGLVTACADILG